MSYIFTQRNQQHQNCIPDNSYFVCHVLSFSRTNSASKQNFPLLPFQHTRPQLYSKTFFFSSLSLFSTCFDVFLSFYPAKSIAKIGNVRQPAPPAAFPTDFARWTQSIMREMHLASSAHAGATREKKNPLHVCY
jgi:hypothetical protein